MPHSTKIDFHGTHFVSRTALRAHLRRMRARWNEKGPLRGRDLAFVTDLFLHHPQALKLSTEAQPHFEVHLAPDPTDGYPPTPCFWVRDDAGDLVPFSMAPAIKELYRLDVEAKKKKPKKASPKSPSRRPAPARKALTEAPRKEQDNGR